MRLDASTAVVKACLAPSKSSFLNKTLVQIVL